MCEQVHWEVTDAKKWKCRAELDSSSRIARTHLKGGVGLVSPEKQLEVLPTQCVPAQQRGKWLSCVETSSTASKTAIAYLTE